MNHLTSTASNSEYAGVAHKKAGLFRKRHLHDARFQWYVGCKLV